MGFYIPKMNKTENTMTSFLSGKQLTFAAIKKFNR